MRSELFASPSSLYLLSHSVGLLPLSAKAHFDRHYFAPWSDGNQEIWPQWIDAIGAFRDVVARLLNTDIRQICPQSNISSGLTKILSALPQPAPNKNVLLLSEHDFPSVGFVCQRALSNGYRLKYMPKDANHTDIHTWEEYLSADVAAVIVTHVQSNTGVKIPFERICDIARSRNIYSIVDIAQSAGVIPIDVGASCADFILGSCVKWLCGGPGAGFLWIHKALLGELQPRDVGWFSHQNPFEFEIHHFEYADDALRFWGGTPTVAPFIVAAHSISLLLDIGIEVIAEHNRKCKRYLLDHIDEGLMVSPTDEALQSGTLIFHSRPQYRQALDCAQVQYDSRNTGIRLSSHIYTPLDDLEKLVHCFSG